MVNGRNDMDRDFKPQNIYLKNLPLYFYFRYQWKEVIHISEVEWEYYMSSRYYIPTLKIKENREDAKDFCASLGGHLVALETPEENEYITNLVFQTGRPTIFLESGFSVHPK